MRRSWRALRSAPPRGATSHEARKSRRAVWRFGATSIRHAREVACRRRYAPPSGGPRPMFLCVRAVLRAGRTLGGLRRRARASAEDNRRRSRVSAGGGLGRGVPAGFSPRSEDARRSSTICVDLRRRSCSGQWRGSAPHPALARFGQVCSWPVGTLRAPGSDDLVRDSEDSGNRPKRLALPLPTPDARVDEPLRVVSVRLGVVPPLRFSVLASHEFSPLARQVSNRSMERSNCR